VRWRTTCAIAAGVVTAPLVALFWLGEASRESDDLATLQDIVAIPAGATSARWEIFGTPEAIGLVPGPTDYHTLIAELQPALAPAVGTAAAQRDEITVMPEAARHWLSDGFRALMEQNRNARLRLSAHKNCRAYQTTLRKSGRHVQGFLCTDAGHTLLYLDVT